MSIDSIRGLEPGDLFTTNGKDVWRLESYCDYSTISLINVGNGELCSGAVGCLNLQPFVRLIPAEDLKEK
jgi:hypothetical protein